MVAVKKPFLGKENTEKAEVLHKSDEYKFEFVCTEDVRTKVKHCVYSHLEKPSGGEDLVKSDGNINAE